MAAEQELGSMVVRLLGDASDYVKTLSEAVAHTLSTTKKLADAASAPFDTIGEKLGGYLADASNKIAYWASDTVKQLKHALRFDQQGELKVDMGSMLQGLTQMSQSLPPVLRQTSTAVLNLASSFTDLAKAGMASAAEQRQLELRLGATAEGAAKLQQAARLAGTSTEDVGTAFTFMQRKLNEATQGSASAQQAFAKLGLSGADLSQMPIEEAMTRITARQREMEANARKTSEREIFGRGGGEELDRIAKQMERASEMAKDYGLALSNSDKETIKLAASSQQFAKASAGALWQSLTQNVATAMAPMLTAMSDAFGKAVRFAQPLVPLFRTVATVVGSIVAGVMDVVNLVLAILGPVLEAAKAIAGIIGQVGDGSADIIRTLSAITVGVIIMTKVTTIFTGAVVTLKAVVAAATASFRLALAALGPIGLALAAIGVVTALVGGSKGPKQFSDTEDGAKQLKEIKEVAKQQAEIEARKKKIAQLESGNMSRSDLRKELDKAGGGDSGLFYWGNKLRTGSQLKDRLTTELKKELNEQMAASDKSRADRFADAILSITSNIDTEVRKRKLETDSMEMSTAAAARYKQVQEAAYAQGRSAIEIEEKLKDALDKQTASLNENIVVNARRGLRDQNRALEDQLDTLMMTADEAKRYQMVMQLIRDTMDANGKATMTFEEAQKKLQDRLSENKKKSEQLQERTQIRDWREQVETLDMSQEQKDIYIKRKRGFDPKRADRLEEELRIRNLALESHELDLQSEAIGKTAKQMEMLKAVRTGLFTQQQADIILAKDNKVAVEQFIYAKQQERAAVYAVGAEAEIARMAKERNLDADQVAAMRAEDLALRRMNIDKQIRDGILQQVMHFRKAASQIDDYQMVLNGATRAQLDYNNALKLLQEGQQTTTQFETKRETFALRMTQLNRQLKGGVISWMTYTRAVADAQTKLQGANAQLQQLQGALFGSAEAISRYNAYREANFENTAARANREMLEGGNIFGIAGALGRPEAKAPIGVNVVQQGVVGAGGQEEVVIVLKRIEKLLEKEAPLRVKAI